MVRTDLDVMAPKMYAGKRLAVLFLLAALALPACDSDPEEIEGDLYELSLEGTEDLLFSCTITLVTSSDTSSATFEALSVPDAATLGIVLGARAKCTKLEELGLLRVELFRNGLIADAAQTEASFGSVIVAHPQSLDSLEATSPSSAAGR